MKIQKIELSNIGPYSSGSEFAFHTGEPGKNIILIGGRNGAGKTTLFDAIRLCLYGYKLYGYRQNSQAYTAKVKKLINDGAKRASVAHAGVALTIHMDEGYHNNSFHISRQWSLHGNQVKETYTVRKDGLPLEPEEQADFDAYLLQTIPPALFNLHFFNGETIGSFLFDRDDGASFRRAFMQLCGLDTLDLIEEQLKQSVKTRAQDAGAGAERELEEKSREKTRLMEEEAQLEARLRQLQEEVNGLEEARAKLDADMARFGGVAAGEWERLHQGIKEEEALREEQRKFLKDCANHVIPFLILERELEALREQMELEARLAENRAVKERLFQEAFQRELMERLSPYLNPAAEGLADGLPQALYDALKHDGLEECGELLGLSKSEQAHIHAIMERCAAFDKTRIAKAEKAIKTSLTQTKKLRAQIESKELLDSQSYIQKQNELLVALDLRRKDMLELTMAKAGAGEALKAASLEYEKARSVWMGVQKERSVHDLSARTLLAFDELKQSLYMKYIRLVETAFIRNFNRLIEKEDLLDGIYINSAFEVVPYQNSRVCLDQLREKQKEYGLEFLKEQLGERAFEGFIQAGEGAREAELPVKIDKHFSAGEHQIFVMALYQALSELRTSEIPFVIDTPLARIDSRHRKNILENFFSKLNGQVIILSTDEEIDRKHAPILEGRLSDVYLIEHQAGGESRILQAQYFEEVPL